MRTTEKLLRFRPWRAALRVEVGRDVEVTGTVWLPGQGRVRIGHGVRLLARRAPIELHAHKGAEVWIDDGAVIDGGTSIEATVSVHVGPRARVGAFCKLMDNDFHATVGDRKVRPPGMPVVVGADGVIGPRAILLRGAELGPRARLAPGAVLSFRLPITAEPPARGRAVPVAWIEREATT